MTPPAPSQAWLKQIRDDWVLYWDSLVGQRLQGSDIPPLRRLFDLYDERERAQRELRKPGSRYSGERSQKKPSPLFAIVAGLDTKIQTLEVRYGMSPVSRAYMGKQTSGNGAGALPTDTGEDDESEFGDRDLRG